MKPGQPTRIPFLGFLALLCFVGASPGVGETTTDLPDPFSNNDGERVETPEDWRVRRGEILDLLLEIEYGHPPPAPGNLRVLESTSNLVLDGAAKLVQARVATGPEEKLVSRMAVFLPTRADLAGGSVPVIFANDQVWLEHLRPIAREIVGRGYAYAGFDRHGFEADNADRSDGAHPLYPEYDWGTIAIWAWGCSRVLDWLETFPEIDSTRVAVTGHSRGGKTVLLAGALDERFALVAPNGSGAGGAGSYRIEGKGCETLELITQPERFGYWFHPRLREYVGKEETLPFDQHFLRALIAPRPLISLDALGDLWANPIGTQQMFRAAQPVYDFLGAPKNNALHFREGTHDMLREDYEALLDFSDHHFFGKPLPESFRDLPFPDAPKPYSWQAPDRK